MHNPKTNRPFANTIRKKLQALERDPKYVGKTIGVALYDITLTTHDQDMLQRAYTKRVRKLAKRNLALGA